MNYCFINYIKSIVDIPQEQENKFCSLISIKHIKKGEIFLSEGQLVKEPLHLLKADYLGIIILVIKGMNLQKGFLPKILFWLHIVQFLKKEAHILQFKHLKILKLK